MNTAPQDPLKVIELMTTVLHPDDALSVKRLELGVSV